MGLKLTTHRSLLAMALGFGLVFGAHAVEAPDIGPLPEMKIDAAKAELGKRLFFDKRLSGDAGIACSDCHAPENGYGSKEALSPGYPGNGHFRNAPTLINTALKTGLGHPWNWDGRIGTNLNDMTREMLTEDYIMNMDMRIMQERLKQDPKQVPYALVALHHVQRPLYAQRGLLPPIARIRPALYPGGAHRGAGGKVMTDSTKNDSSKDQSAAEHGKCMMSRRKFLLYSGAGAAAASTISITLFPGTAQATQAKARVVGYPRKKIASLSQLQDHPFFCPWRLYFVRLEDEQKSGATWYESSR